MPEPPAIDGRQIAPFVPDIIILADPPTLVVQGESGAATPDSTVRALNLDNATAGVETLSRADGSFELIIAAAQGDELRFEVLAGALRSPPVDVILTQSGVNDAFVPSPRHGCVRLVPGLQVPFAQAGSARLVVNNDCAEIVSLSAPRLRSGASAFELLTPLPLDVMPGGSAELELDFDPNAMLPAEDVLFIDLGREDELIRYPVGLYAVE
jgi:hypothetical protein